MIITRIETFVTNLSNTDLELKIFDIGKNKLVIFSESFDYLFFTKMVN